MDQMWAFFGAAHRNLNQETLELAVSMRVAFGSDQTGWQKFVQAFLPKKMAQKVTNIMPKEKYKQVRRLLHGE